MGNVIGGAAPEVNKKPILMKQARCCAAAYSLQREFNKIIWAFCLIPAREGRMLHSCSRLVSEKKIIFLEASGRLWRPKAPAAAGKIPFSRGRARGLVGGL